MPIVAPHFREAGLADGPQVDGAGGPGDRGIVVLDRGYTDWSLSNLVALLRMNPFTHRDLGAWLDQPFDGPPAVLVTTQQELALG